MFKTTNPTNKPSVNRGMAIKGKPHLTTGKQIKGATMAKKGKKKGGCGCK
ncbi:MAG: hypothetical protein KGV51_01010 [Moraxellaceae bacterium]|nr:hypothetical protein [Moraxellaceae bacterium]